MSRMPARVMAPPISSFGPGRSPQKTMPRPVANTGVNSSQGMTLATAWRCTRL